MAQIQTGTVSVTQNTNIVTGVGTTWVTSGVNVGDSFKVANVPALYGIIAIDSETQIRISPNYAGTTVSGANYQITNSWSPSLGLAEIAVGDSEFAFHLTHEVIRKLDTLFSGGAPTGTNTGDETSASIKAKLGITTLSGVNTGDQTITLTGDVTGSGTGTFAATIANSSVTLGKMADLAANSILGNNTASPTAPIALTTSQTKTLLGLNNVTNESKATMFTSPTFTGNVLVGTTTDDAVNKLQVNGSAAIGIPAGTADTANLYLTNNTVTGVATSSLLFAGTGNAIKARIKSAVYGDGFMAFHTNNDTEKMRITAGGNVLIGSSTDDGATNKLQVNGNTLIVGEYLHVGGTNSTQRLRLYAPASANATILTRTNYGIEFGTNDLTRMTVAASGNILIGSTTDSLNAKLQVVGTSANPFNSIFVTTNTFTPSSTGSTLRLGHVASSGNTVANIENLTNGGTSAGVLALNGQSSSGNVLIGTTTDNGVNKLQVSGYAKFSLAPAAGPPTVSISQSSDNPLIELQRWTGSGSNYRGFRIKGTTSGSSGLAFECSTVATIETQVFTEAMRVSGGGNVLIGTTTDDGVNKLQVSGSVSTTGSLTITAATPWVTLQKTAGQAGGVALKTGTTNRFLVMTNGSAESGSNTGADFEVRSYADDGTTQLGTPLFIKRSTGNVLVATTTDDGANKLQVNGPIRFQPSASSTPANNGDMTFEATSNTSINIKFKGSDGVVRSTTLTLS